MTHLIVQAAGLTGPVIVYLDWRLWHTVQLRYRVQTQCII